MMNYSAAEKFKVQKMKVKMTVPLRLSIIFLVLPREGDLFLLVANKSYTTFYWLSKKEMYF